MSGFYWERHPDGLFGTLIAVAATCCSPEAYDGAYEDLISWAPGARSRRRGDPRLHGRDAKRRLLGRRPGIGDRWSGPERPPADRPWRTGELQLQLPIPYPNNTESNCDYY